MVGKFWWGQTSEKSKMARLSWDKMCRPKEEGGPGFQDLKGFQSSSIAEARMETLDMYKFFSSSGTQGEVFPYWRFSVRGDRDQPLLCMA